MGLIHGQGRWIKLRRVMNLDLVTCPLFNVQYAYSVPSLYFYRKEVSYVGILNRTILGVFLFRRNILQRA